MAVTFYDVSGRQHTTSEKDYIESQLYRANEIARTGKDPYGAGETIDRIQADLARFGITLTPKTSSSSGGSSSSKKVKAYAEDDYYMKQPPASAPASFPALNILTSGNGFSMDSVIKVGAALLFLSLFMRLIRR